MNTKKAKSIQYYMRALHRDIGYLLIGLTLVYALSGIVLVYRGTDFLKQEITVEEQLSTGMGEEELGDALRWRHFQVTGSDGATLFFEDGTYNTETGLVKYTEKSYPSFISKMNSLHKRSSRDLFHVLSVVYGILLTFMALSSFWMYKPRTKKFRRAIVLSVLGIVLAVVLVFV